MSPSAEWQEIGEDTNLDNLRDAARKIKKEWPGKYQISLVVKDSGLHKLRLKHREQSATTPKK